MARLPRYFAHGLTQHIVQRGNDRRTTFRVDADYLVFLTFLRQACARFEVAVHGFVLMTNHFHLLVTPEHETSIPRMMQAVGSRYAGYFNDRHHRTGALWEGRYRAFVVETGRYVLTCLRYVELNPVRAGMVERPEEYEWSSYRANALGIEDHLVQVHPILKDLWGEDGERRMNYRHLCDDALSARELRRVRDAAHHGWALGGPHFIKVVEARCRRPARRRACGPKRT